MVSNYSYGAAFDKVDYLIKEEAINDHSLLMKFKLKRFEIGIGNEYVVNFHAQELGFAGDIVFLRPSVTRDPLYIGFSKAKNQSEIAEQFSQAIEKLKKNNRYEEILKFYGVR